MKPMKALLFACLGLAGSVVAADLAQAQALTLNGAGSSAGRQFATLVPTDLALCDAGSTPVLFQSAEVPPNRTEWQCTLGGQARTYRYSASASADGYTLLPNGAAATAPYLNLTTATTGACPAPTPGTINGRAVNISTCGSPAGPNNVPPAVVNAPASQFVVHYGASDVKPSSFNVSANGATISPPAAGHLTPNPIVAVPFSIVVGSGVTAGNLTPLLNLTSLEVRQILSGDIEGGGGDWTTLGHNTTTTNKTIVVCQRTVPSGTLATLMQTVMQSPFAFTGINPIASATNIFNASSSNVKACVENNPNSIGYIDSDTVPALLNGAHQVALDGFLPSNPALPAGIDRTRDLRCGKYAYWADWVIVTRNAGVQAAPINAPAGTNALLTLFQNRAIANNPLPSFWGGQNDMFVFKSDDKGPHNWLPTNGNNVNASTACSNAGSIQ
jgi:hypothetical protein